MILPPLLMVAMSWCAFWLEPAGASSRLGITAASLLGLSMYGQLDPDVPLAFFRGSLLLVSLALVEVVFTSVLSRLGQEDWARVLEWWSRWLFPFTYGLLVAWTLTPRHG